MFPPSGASIYHNEEGEVVGWSDESSFEPEFDPFGDDEYDEYDDDEEES